MTLSAGGAYLRDLYPHYQLTLGSKLSIVDNAASGVQGIRCGTLVNQGAITVSKKTASLYLNAQTITNSGAITATAGLLRLADSTFVNSGQITAIGSGNNARHSIGRRDVDHGAYILTNSGGVLALNGSLNNASSTLTVGTGQVSGTLTLAGGTISGGTVVDAGSAIAFSGGVLDGVTYQGAMNLAAKNSDVTVSSAGIILQGVGGTGPRNDQSFRLRRDRMSPRERRNWTTPP